MVKPQKEPENILVALPQANLRLKAAKIPVQIVLLSNGNKLGLQATLPDKKDPNARWYQQKISLGVPASLEGLEYAEAEARVVGGLLAKRQFSWAPYLKQKPAEKPVYIYIEDAIEGFKEEYFKRRGRTERTESTWETNYEDVFKKLISKLRNNNLRVNASTNNQPASDPKPSKTKITVQRLLKVIDTTAANTRSRQRDCIAINKLAKFLNLDLGVDLKEFEGVYLPKPRVIPSDKEINEKYYKLPPKWRPAYGMIATYGLRPYELPYIDTTDLDKGGYTISITLSKSSKKKKVSTRRIYPYYREWIEQFGLRNAQLPKLTGRNNKKRGAKVSIAFRNAEVGFVPYDLRHAWAIRLIAFGVPISIAAKMMDHSVQVHEETYEAWIPPNFNDQVFETSYRNPQRPEPPKVDIPVDEISLNCDGEKDGEV